MRHSGLNYVKHDGSNFDFARVSCLKTQVDKTQKHSGAELLIKCVMCCYNLHMAETLN